MVSIGTGAPLRIDSSKKMNCSMAERPCPPHSLGQPMPSQPSVPICLTTLRTTGPMPWRASQLGLDLGGEEVLVVGPQLVLQRLLLLGVRDLHGVPPGPAPLRPTRAHSGVSDDQPTVWCAVEHVTVRPSRAANGPADGTVATNQ